MRQLLINHGVSLNRKFTSIERTLDYHIETHLKYIKHSRQAKEDRICSNLIKYKVNPEELYRITVGGVSYEATLLGYAILRGNSSLIKFLLESGISAPSHAYNRFEGDTFSANEQVSVQKALHLHGLYHQFAPYFYK